MHSVATHLSNWSWVGVAPVVAIKAQSKLIVDTALKVTVAPVAFTSEIVGVETVVLSETWVRTKFGTTSIFNIDLNSYSS